MNSIRNILKNNRILVRIADSYEFLIPIRRLIFFNFFLIRKFLTKKNFLENILRHGKILYNNKISNCYATFFKDHTPYLKLHHFEGKSQYALQLNNVKIIGSSNVIILGKKYVLYDYNFFEDNNIKFTDSGILYNTKKYCFIDKTFSATEIESGIALNGNFSNNYCHLLIEIISKFQILKELNINRDIPIVLDKICLSHSQFMELITFFNTEKRKLIYIEPRQIYNVMNLVYLSSPNFIAPNFKDLLGSQITFGLLNFKSFQFIKKTMLNHMVSGSIKKKIFISRKNVSNRRSYNELEVQKCVEKYGFECYFPENDSIAEQIFVFKNAEIIVGATGAALTNLVFCDNKCKVICLASYPLHYSPFITIAAFVGLKIYTLHDNNLIISKKTNIQSGFSISIAELESTLDSIMFKKITIR